MQAFFLRVFARVAAAALLLAGSGALAAGGIGTSFPQNFPVIVDHSLGTPVLGFGAAGPVERVPVIFLHGNNDTPYATNCNPYGNMHDFAEYFLAQGYAPSELWGLGYQGDQCDLLADQSLRAGEAHTTMANVPDLRRFVHAVMDYTGAKRVDIVAHSLGAVLVREWLRQDNAYHYVRRVVSVDGPHHGIINCSPNPANFFQYPSQGGFTPDSPVCLEFGAADTPLLTELNRKRNTPGPTRFLAIRNADVSFVFMPIQDGYIPPVPAEDRHGNPHDFSESAKLSDAVNVDVTGQGQYDPFLGTAHLGIVNSPQVWALAHDFLSRKGSGKN